MINSIIEMFGFGKYYRKWIVIFLKDFKSCVNNSENISSRFPVQHGCRQGDPISGYPLILSIKVLVITFKAEGNIMAYKITDNLKHLLDRYADYLTIYIERSESHAHNYANINAVLDIIEKFCILSGLCKSQQRQNHAYSICFYV